MVAINVCRPVPSTVFIHSKNGNQLGTQASGGASQAVATTRIYRRALINIVTAI